MTPGELVALLDTVPELKLDAVALTGELAALEDGGQLTEAAMASLSPRIDRALAELSKYIDQVRKVVARCQQLPAVPSRFTPPGF